MTWSTAYHHHGPCRSAGLSRKPYAGAPSASGESDASPEADGKDVACVRTVAPPFRGSRPQGSRHPARHRCRGLRRENGRERHHFPAGGGIPRDLTPSEAAGCRSGRLAGIVIWRADRADRRKHQRPCAIATKIAFAAHPTTGPGPRAFTHHRCLRLWPAAALWSASPECSAPLSCATRAERTRHPMPGILLQVLGFPTRRLSATSPRYPDLRHAAFRTEPVFTFQQGRCQWTMNAP